MNVSLLIEIPEGLHELLQTFLEQHSDYDQDRCVEVALALLLSQPIASTNGQTVGVTR